MRIATVYLEQGIREAMLQLTQPPFYLERFLLKWSGIVEALNGTTSAQGVAPTTVRWLPFAFPDDRYRYLTDIDRIYSTGSTLLAGAEDGGPRVGFRALFPDFTPRNWGRWTVDFRTFKGALFHPQMEGFDPRNPVSRVNHVLSTIWHRYSQARWEGLDRLFELISGTPFEPAYQRWLTQLGSSGPISGDELCPAGTGGERAILRDRVFDCLENHVFHPDFRAHFHRETQAADSLC